MNNTLFGFWTGHFFCYALSFMPMLLYNVKCKNFIFFLCMYILSPFSCTLNHRPLLTFMNYISISSHELLILVGGSVAAPTIQFFFIVIFYINNIFTVNFHLRRHLILLGWLLEIKG